MLDLTSGGAETEFETSVSCIGGTTCQQGMRDSQGLLAACVKAVREANLPANALPCIHISGCPSSCGTHQTGFMGFRGASKIVDGKPQSAFSFFLGGSDRQGCEAMGTELGIMLESEIPAFLVELGKTVDESGLDFYTWNSANPDGIKELSAKYI